MSIIFYVSRGAQVGSDKDQFKRALDVFRRYLVNEEVLQGVDYYTSDYVICTYKEHQEWLKGNRSEYMFRRANGKKWYLIFESDEEFLQALRDLNPLEPYTWQRLYSHDHLGGIYGYEVTSKGDRRFSPFFMYRDDGISIEEYYQLDAKGYRSDNMTVSEAKGLPPKDPMKITGFWYTALGDHIFTNKGLFYELASIGLTQPLTDMFDPNGGQNKIYCDILNNFYNLNKC